MDLSEVIHAVIDLLILILVSWKRTQSRRGD